MLEATRPLAELQAALAGLPWDSEPLVVLRREHVTEALRRLCTGAWTAGDLEQWADLLEGREDVDLEQGYETALAEVIFELANPVLGGPIDGPRAQALLLRLTS